MSRKKKTPVAQTPAQPRWEFDPDVPTHDFLEDEDLDQTFESFVEWLEEGEFLTWEAVVCQEQGLPLTAEQKRALGKLLSFNDEEDDSIHYINEIPRPSEPWHVILERIAPHLLIEPFETFDIYDEIRLEGWQEIMEALREHGQGLSLPSGVASYREVVPADLRHKLWLQYCVEELYGLGQEEEMTLADEDQQFRIGKFIGRLRECKESVAHLRLTLESLLARVTLPDRDRPLFVQMMQEKLGLSSDREPIAGRL